jgi:hypothetical protein
MCLACELALMIALDDLPATPPPGFPGARADDAARFACDAPADAAPPAAPPATDEHKSIVKSRE